MIAKCFPLGDSTTAPALMTSSLIPLGGRSSAFKGLLEATSLCRDVHDQVINPAATIQPQTAAAISTLLCNRRDATTIRAAPAWEPASETQRSCPATSRVDCQRSSGSFSRHFRMTWSSKGGVRGIVAEIGSGWEETMAAIKLVFDLPVNALFPVAISYKIAPSAKMSVLASASRPSSCSGAMYRKVPRIVPSAVSCRTSVGMLVRPLMMPAPSDAVRANPKSRSFAPDRLNITFSGFKSRWMMPRRCAASSASAIWAP
jgi:hypothetical protein